MDSGMRYRISSSLPRSSRSPAPCCPRSRAPAGSRSSTARRSTAGRSARTPRPSRSQDGAIVVNGPRAHLYYVGPVGEPRLQELRVQGRRHDDAGLELGHLLPHRLPGGRLAVEGLRGAGQQLAHRPEADRRLYSVKDNMEAPAKDGEWFTMQIVVQGKHVTTSVNGKTIVDYTEPEGVQRPADMADACSRAARSRCRATTRRARCSSRTSWSSCCPDGRHQPGYQTTRGSSGARR